MPFFVCSLNHILKPVRSVVLKNKSERRRGEVSGSELVWWAHVDQNEAHVLPNDVEAGGITWSDVLAGET